jgi:hypothetical protein
MPRGIAGCRGVPYGTVEGHRDLSRPQGTVVGLQRLLGATGATGGQQGATNDYGGIQAAPGRHRVCGGLEEAMKGREE